MKKLIFLTLIVSLALVFISCEGDTNTQPEATIGNEETVAETVTTAEATSVEETVAETVTTTEVTSGEETLAETVTTAEATSVEETVAETVTTTEVTSAEETVAETVTTAEVTSSEEIVDETTITTESTSSDEVVATTEESSILETEETTVTEETENKDSYEIKVDDYTFIKNENGCYIKFDDISIYESDDSNNTSGLSEVPNLKFNSIKEFKDALTNGNLENSQKEVISKFPKNDLGEIQTCDFNNLYNVLLPDGLKVSYIKWYGAYYTFFVESESDFWIDAIVVCWDNMEDNIFLPPEYDDFLNSETITETICGKFGDKEIVYEKTYISQIEDKYGNNLYVLQMDSKKIIVSKMSVENDAFGLYPEGGTSYSYVLYCFEGDSYYTVEVGFLNENHLDEWILKFGLTPYIENDHEVM